VKPEEGRYPIHEVIEDVHKGRRTRRAIGLSKKA
jgi:hypothetical protein